MLMRRAIWIRCAETREREMDVKADNRCFFLSFVDSRDQWPPSRTTFGLSLGEDRGLVSRGSAEGQRSTSVGQTVDLRDV